MSKELEALKRIKYKLSSSKANGYWEELDIIENALNDEWFCKHIINKICEYLGLDVKSHRDLVETENEILNILIENENKLKALAILKNKIEFLFNDKEHTIEFRIHYTNGFYSIPLYVGKKEEYDLLKEVLK